MARKVFFSFHYQSDAWRVSQVRSMGKLEGNQLLSSNAWEDVKRGGDVAIRRWINQQLVGKSCVVVLIGSQTASRKWVLYEIEKGWIEGKGVVGVHIHGLLNTAKEQSAKGANPLAKVSVDGRRLSTVAKTHDTPYSTSKYVYDHISRNLAGWVEEAIRIRARF